jgi:hypothetical protein
MVPDLPDTGLHDPASFTSYWTETLIAKLRVVFPHSRFSWWKTGRIRQVDLLAEIGELRIGFCLCRHPPSGNRERAPLLIARERGVIHQGYVLHRGTDSYMAARGVPALPMEEFMREMTEWIFERQSPVAALAAIKRKGGGVPPPSW